MLHVHHCSTHAPQHANTLAEFHFGLQPPDRRAPQQVHVPLALLNAGELIECWSIDSPVICGTFRDFAFTHDGDYLIASVVVDAGICRRELLVEAEGTYCLE